MGAFDHLIPGGDEDGAAGGGKREGGAGAFDHLIPEGGQAAPAQRVGAAAQPAARKPITLGDRAAGQDWAWGKVKQGARALGEAVGVIDPPSVLDDPAVHKGAERPASTAPSMAPVDEKVRQQFDAAWDAATPEQRATLSQRNGWMGQLARERAGMFENPQATITDTGRKFDTRIESRTDRLVGQGEDPRFAREAAKVGASAGVKPGQEVAAMGDTIQESKFDFETAQDFDPNAPSNGLNRTLGRGLAKGGLGVAKAVAGYGQALAELYGLDAATQQTRDLGDWARGKEDAIGNRGDFLQRNMEGAIASIAQQLPLLALGAANASQAIPLAGMAVQAFGQEYSDGRDAKLAPREAAARASLMSAFEVIGEKFGLGQQLELMRRSAKGVETGQLANFFGEWIGNTLKREIPGELLTTTGQFGVDKMDGIGLQPNATWADYTQQVADTIAQTVLQGGVMAGGTTGVGAAADHLGAGGGRTPEQAEAEALAARDRALRAWESARQKGFVVEPPAPGEKPSVRRGKAVEMFKELGAMFGIPQAAQDLAIQHAEGRPVQGLPQFFAKYAEALKKRGLIAADLDPDVLEAMRSAEMVQAPVEQRMGQAGPEMFQPQQQSVQAGQNLEQMAAQAQQGDAIAAVPQGSLLDAMSAVTGLAEDVAPAPAQAQAEPPAAGVDISTPVDAAAHQAATSPTNDLPEPSQAMKEAGNYKVGRTRIAGLDIRIENPQGSKRRGTAPDGTPWETEMRAHYGYVAGTEAADGDKLDVFVKAGTSEDWRGPVFVIDQVDPKTGEFDETKSMFGFSSLEEAERAYRDNYSADWNGFAGITQLPLAAFKAWARSDEAKYPLGDLNAWKESARTGKSRAVQDVAEHQGSMQQPKESVLPQLRRQGDQATSGMGGELSGISVRSRGEAEQAAQPGSEGQQRELRAGQRKVADKEGAGTQPAQEQASYVQRQNTGGRSLGGGAESSVSNDLLQDLSTGNERQRGAINPSEQVQLDASQDSSTAGEAATKRLKEPLGDIAARPQLAPNRKPTNEPQPSQAQPASTAAQADQAPADQGRTAEAGSGEAGRGVPGAGATATTEAAGLKARKTRKHPPLVRGSGALADISRALGGLSPDLLADLSEKVSRVRAGAGGKKTQYTAWDNPAIPGVGPLFRKGGTADLSEVARVLEEGGYLEAGAGERDPVGATQRAQDIIKAELRKGGSTLQVGNADAIDAEMRARQDAAMDDMADPWDDFAFTPDDLDEVGFSDADQATRALTEQLIAEAQNLGIDADSIREDVARSIGEEASQEEYHAAIQDAIRQAVAQTRQDAGRGDAGPTRAGDQDGRRATGDSREAGSRSEGRQGGPDQEGLTLQAQTEQDLRTKAEREDAATKAEATKKAAEQARLKQADDQRDTRARADATVDDFQLGQSAEQQLSGMGDLFAQKADPGGSQGDAAGGSRPTPAAQPSANTIFTEDAAAAARARLKAKLGRVQSGIDPEMLMDGLTLAGYHIEKGARTFAAFARAMLEDLGEGAKPYLKSWYMGVKYDPRAAGFTGMSTAAEVESADLDAIADNQTQEGNDDVPSTSTDLERDRTDAAGGQRVLAVADGEGSAAADRGTGEAGSRAGAQGGRRSGDAVVPAGSTTAARDSGDQPVRGRTGKPGASLVPAGSDIDQRGGGFGDRGIPVETVSADATRRAAQDGLAQGLTNQAQRLAPTQLKLGDIDNIRATLPALLPGQQDDVLKAENRFAQPDGYGILFTNGTGTGKTYTGLGVIKRMALQGKENILLAAPSDKVIEDWINSGKTMGLNITKLDSTKDAGKGIVITTYANLGDNMVLGDRRWDGAVLDEAHYLMSSKDGTTTNALKALRAITFHPDGVSDLAAMRNRELGAKVKDLSDKIKSLDKIMGLDDLTFEVRASYQRERDALEKKLAPLSEQLKEANGRVREEVLTNQEGKRPRVTFLSATPWAYVQALDWSNGYLFEFDEGKKEDRPSGTGGRSYNEGSNRQQFYMQHFGYRMRYNKLTRPDAKVDVGLMERQFNAWLRQRGVLSRRALEVAADYDRRFILLESAIGTRIDEALTWVGERAYGNKEAGIEGSKAFQTLSAAINDKFDYLSRRYLLEAIKATEVIPIVRQHLAKGRKVVVFHDFKKGGGFNPFAIKAPNAGEAMTTEQADAFNEALFEFQGAFPDLINYPFERMPSPIQVFSRDFPDLLLFNGDVASKDRREAVKTFQDDATGPRVILVQSAAGKEGISLHDTTGKHQRALINLGQPTAPTTAIQQEGRIYRTGQVTDAILRYLTTGTTWERYAFASQVATRSATVENLAAGEEARALADAFIAAYEEADVYEPGHEGEGAGGKQRDKAAYEALTEFDRAVSFYYGTQKKNAKTKAKEGADYFATPEPLGLKMVEWANVHPGDSVLEPSAGHGAIARWFPQGAQRSAIEPSLELRSRLAMVFGDGKLMGGDFESHHVVNKYDAIVMNPPFGTAGRTAVDHLAKAADHLREGGRIVAIIPTGPAADKKFDKWFYEEDTKPVKPLTTIEYGMGPQELFRGDTIKTRASFAPQGTVLRMNAEGTAVWVKVEGKPGETTVTLESITAHARTGPRTETFRPAEGLTLVADLKLPQVTFERAGTGVATRVVVIEKAREGEVAPAQRNADFTGTESVEDFFKRIRDYSLPKRAKPEPTIEELEAADPAAQKVDAKREAKAEKAAAQKQGTEVAASSGMEIVEHVTTKGKTLRGVIRKDLSQAQAKEIDAYTFKKDGGWFIRAEHIPKMVGGGGVAQEPGAEYSVREQESLFSGGDAPTAGRLGYETDLFGNPLPADTGRLAPARPGGAGVRGDAQPSAGQRDTAAPAGRYRVRTIVGTEASRKLGVGVIKTPQQAAQATAYLYRSAVERFDAIVTDAAGKPLAVVGGFKGSINQTSVYPATVVAEAVRVPGAARIWFSHNHPSGTNTLSSADRMLGDGLAAVFEGSGIEPMGMLAVAGKQYAFAAPNGKGEEEGDIPAPVGSMTVPVIEREQVNDPEAQGFHVINSPALAREYAQQLYGTAGKPGLVLLDSQHKVAAWVPLDPSMMGRLKGAGGLSAIYRAISESNAGSVIIVHGGELSARRGDGSAWTIAQNIGAAARAVDTRVLDIIDVKAGKSEAERGESLEASSVFSVEPTLSRGAADGAGGGVGGGSGAPGILGIGAKPSVAVGNRPTISRADLDELIVGNVDNWRGIGLDRVVAVDIWAGLPEQVLTDARNKGFHPGLIEGVVHRNRVYLVRAALRDKDHAERVLFHEAYGHMGTRIALEGKPTRALDALWGKLNGLAGVAKLAKQYQVGDGMTAWDRLQPYVRGTQPDTTTRRAQIMDELIAFLAQANDTSALTQFKTYLSDLKGAMVALARRLGLDGLADRLDRAGAELDVLQLVRDARRAVQTGTSRKGSLVVFGSDPAAAFSEGEQSGQFSVAGQGFSLPEFGRTGKFVEAIQDRYNRWKQAVESVRTQGGTVTEANDFYAAEERYWGIVGAQLDDFKAEVEDFVKAVQGDDLALSDVALYAYAKHAPERNARIAEINEAFPDGGSGMTNAQAADIIAKARKDGLADKLERHVGRLHRWSARTREVLRDNGLITQDEFDSWDSGYQFYVPLRGKPGQPETRGGMGQGFDIRGRESFRAMGRRSMAGNVVEHILQDRARALVRSGKNEVLRRFARFVLDNPDPNLWKVNAVKTRRALVNTPMGEQVVEWQELNDDRNETVGVKDAGRTLFIEVKDSELLKQLKNLHDEARLPVVVEALHWANRLLSRMYTSLNPVFTVLNGARDATAGTVNMLGVAGPAGARRMAANLPAAYREAFRAEVLGKPSAMYEEYRRTGGKTGFMDFKDIEAYGDELAAIAAESQQWSEAVKQEGWQKARALWLRSRGTARRALDRIEDLNASVENATRFAAFKAARETGKSVAEAASIAKNITVNFNRKGTMTPVLASVFLFFNPAVQGTARMLQALQSRDVQAALGGAMVGIFALALANASIGDEDEGDGIAYWDKIPENVKDRNLVIMLPPGSNAGEKIPGTEYGRYIKIPLPYGYNTFATLATTVADVARNQMNPKAGVSAAAGAQRVFKSFIGSWLPASDIAPSLDNPKGIALAFVPDALDPVVEPVLNINSFGSAMYPEGLGADKTPDSEKVFAGQKGGWAHQSARWMNEATGGSQYHEGAISVTPATINNVVRGYGGGVASFIMSVGDVFATQGVSRDEPEWWRAPFAKQLFGTVDMIQDQGLAYERLQQIDAAAEPLKRAEKAGDKRAAEAIRDDAGAIAGLGKMANQARQRLTEIRKQEIRIIESERMTPAEKNAALRQWDRERQRVYDRVNRSWSRAVESDAYRPE